MVQECVSETGLPVSGIGGVSNWRDAAEFMLLGCGTVQVCTAVMHHGFGIVDGMKDRLSEWMLGKGFASIEDFRGQSSPRVVNWGRLNLDYKVVARIDERKCIGCGLCTTACQDGAYQCIYEDRETGGVAGPDGSVPLARIPRVDEAACVGCNLCALVCPVDGCVEMVEVSGESDEIHAERLHATRA